MGWLGTHWVVNGDNGRRAMNRVTGFLRSGVPRTFADRREAGRALADRLRSSTNRPDLVIVGLARGGVPVAAEVARALGATLDVVVVRKLGVPGHEELAMGAISRTKMVVNDRLVADLGISKSVLAAVVERERQELTRREQAYRSGRPPTDLGAHPVILVDDGLATGASMHVAALAVAQERPARLVVAVPTAPTSACRDLARCADEVISLDTPAPFIAVGMSYRDFRQVSDDEVRALLG